MIEKLVLKLSTYKREYLRKIYKFFNISSKVSHNMFDNSKKLQQEECHCFEGIQYEKKHVCLFCFFVFRKVDLATIKGNGLFAVFEKSSLSGSPKRF